MCAGLAHCGMSSAGPGNMGGPTVEDANIVLAVTARIGPPAPPAEAK